MQLPLGFSGNLFHVRQPELVFGASLVPMVVRQSFLRAATIFYGPTSHAQEILPGEIRYGHLVRNTGHFFLLTLSTVRHRTTSRQSPLTVLRISTLPSPNVHSTGRLAATGRRRSALTHLDLDDGTEDTGGSRADGTGAGGNGLKRNFGVCC